MVEAYHNAIRSVELWGPTNFAPIINHVAKFAQEAKRNVESQVCKMERTTSVTQSYILCLLAILCVADVD